MSNISVLTDKPRETETKRRPSAVCTNVFDSDPCFSLGRRIKAERIMHQSAPWRKNRRNVSLSSRRMIRPDIDGINRVYIMEFHPLERTMIETREDGCTAEYTFDFKKWRALTKTKRLAAKLLYLHYRDIFGDPSKPSMDIAYLERRYSLSAKAICDILADAEREVCEFGLISTK